MAKRGAAHRLRIAALTLFSTRSYVEALNPLEESLVQGGR